MHCNYYFLFMYFWIFWFLPINTSHLFIYKVLYIKSILHCCLFSIFYLLKVYNIFFFLKEIILIFLRGEKTYNTNPVLKMQSFRPSKVSGLMGETMPKGENETQMWVGRASGCALGLRVPSAGEMWKSCAFKLLVKRH